MTETAPSAQAAAEIATARRRLALKKLGELACEQLQVVSRRQLYGAGVTRGYVRAQLEARRWRVVSPQCVCLHTGPLPRAAELWAAVLEAGPRAVLDGASALEASGLTGFETERIRVSVFRGAKVVRTTTVDVRQTRRLTLEDTAPSGVPRTRVPTAAVRGAMWARSDKQAALLLTMVVQQGLSTAEKLGVAMLAVRRDKRRDFIHAVILDLLGGVRSLPELDFACLCRERGLPEPSRQVLRKTTNGCYYLDVVWDEWKVVVEIDGVQHVLAPSVVDDALRQNEVTLRDATVLRLPVLGLRVAPEQLFDQIRRALADNGCPWLTERTA